MVDVSVPRWATNPVPLMQSSSFGGDLLIVAGEASGDLHGARLLAELRAMAPGLLSYGLGGQELRSAGMELVAESADISVVGITEVLRILPRAREIYRHLLTEVDKRGTRVALLIDFPDFNLRLARDLANRGVKILYYISPQVWAWRRGRVKNIRSVVDRMLVILPFEVDFYTRHDVDALHVGHPLVDEVPELPQAWDSVMKEGDPVRIALLPGSRVSEVKSNLPAMLGAAKRIASARDCKFALIKAEGLSGDFVQGFLADQDLDIEVVLVDRFRVIAESHLAICASGTATLEVGLLGTPMVVVYRVSLWTYVLGKLLVRLPYIALVNLVLDRLAVPELLQGAASEQGIANACIKLMSNRDRIRQMRSDLGELRGVLGESGASRRAAEMVFAELETQPLVGAGGDSF